MRRVTNATDIIASPTRSRLHTDLTTLRATSLEMAGRTPALETLTATLTRSRANLA